MSQNAKLDDVTMDGYTVIVDETKFKVLKKDCSYYIRVISEGVSLASLNEAISRENIVIRNFVNLRSAVVSKQNEILYFGEEKDDIILFVSRDETRAYVRFEKAKDFLKDREKREEKIKRKLEQEGIVAGINLRLLNAMEVVPLKTNILVAETQEPIPGKDSVVKIYQKRKIQPKELEDGGVDHKDMGIVNNVQEGEWLGEWTYPTDGISGLTIRNKKISAHKGNLKTIPYDSSSVKEITMDDKVILVATREGAFYYDDEVGISVLNHMVIRKVDNETGDVKFDGFVTIVDGVEDGFSVWAKKDIIIESKRGLGIGKARSIISEAGDVIIMGGVAGDGTTIIQGQNILSKFLSGVRVLAKDKIQAISYIRNSFIEAPVVIVDGKNGHIVGGEIKNVTQMAVTNIGTQACVETKIYLAEIKRNEIEKNLKSLSNKIEKNKTNFFKLNKLLYEQSSDSENYQLISSKLDYIELSLKEMQKDSIFMKRMLSMRGNAEIKIKGFLFPGVKIFTTGDVFVCHEKSFLSKIVVKNGQIECIA